MDQSDRALHAMGKIARKIDPETGEMDFPEKPPRVHWSRYNRLADRFEHQSNVWNIATMRRLGMFLPRLQRQVLKKTL
jgi:hypothetical protein